MPSCDDSSSIVTPIGSIFAEDSIAIPIRSILPVDSLMRYEDPDSEREWSQVRIELTVAAFEEEKSLAAKHMQCEFAIWHGGEATRLSAAVPYNCQLREVIKNAEPRIYYIALKAETARELNERERNILDYRSFGTHGYIPVWITHEAAVEALNQHCGRKVEHRKELKIFIYENSKLYYRSDHYDKFKYKLFFPIPLGIGLP